MANINTFLDDFDGVAIDSGVWNDTGDVSVASSILSLGDDDESTIDTVSTYELGDYGGIEMKATAYPPGSSGASYSYLHIVGVDDPADYMAFEFDNDFGEAYALFSDNDGDEDGELLSFNPATFDLWLRIRIDDDGTAYWDTSSDGESWTNVWSYANAGAVVDWSTVNIAVSVDPFGGTGETWQIDHVRGINGDGSYFTEEADSILTLPSVGLFRPIASS